MSDVKGAVARLLCLVWSALLISFMSTGTMTTAHIGEMRWTPENDVWAAAIAISQINFGLPGHLGYHEVEQAILNVVTSTGTASLEGGPETQRLLEDPSVVTRGFQAGASVKEKDLAVPAVNAGYLIDWGGDVGYHDFYNLAFRLFGFSAFSTHWLYFCILITTCLLFILAFMRDNVAIASLTLSITALSLLSSAPFFNSSVPDFASGRSVSTLAIIPFLHIVLSVLRRSPLGIFEIVLLGAQAWLMTFAIAARASASWCILALITCMLAIYLIRRWHVRERPTAGDGRMRRLMARLTFPHGDRVYAAGAITLAVFFAFAFARTPWIDEEYFSQDDYPHHLFWHNAYLGLQMNPEWSVRRPGYPDVGAFSDAAGFELFAHAMIERGLPYLGAAHPEYIRARPYEAFIRDQYLKFLVRYPLYTAKLFLFYKPIAYFRLITFMAGGIPIANWLMAAISLALASLCFTSSGSSIFVPELLISSGVIWLSSSAVIMWAAPGGAEASDQIWSSLFLPLILLGSLGRAFAEMLLAKSKPRTATARVTMT